MKQISEELIEQKARELAAQKKLWHYHLLTPSCKFNDRKEHAFFLENNTDNEYFVSYSDVPAMSLGKRLLQILHGEDLLNNQSEQVSVSESTKRILDKAAQLNARGKNWHHHVFFPHCVFNKYPGKWNITFEDVESDSVLESVSSENPKEDQKEIERLYYLQKTIT